MDLSKIRERLIESLEDFLLNAESKDIVKSAYRIKNLLSAVKDIAEIEKLYAEQTYKTVKHLVIQELKVKYPIIAELLDNELSTIH